MSKTIIEVNSGLFGQIGRVLRNRAFLGMAVVLLSGWNIYKWWWQEDVCAARYRHADKVFKAQTAKTNARVRQVEKAAQTRANAAQRTRASQQERAAQLGQSSGATGVMPRKIHGAIQEVR